MFAAIEALVKSSNIPAPLIQTTQNVLTSDPNMQMLMSHALMSSITTKEMKKSYEACQDLIEKYSLLKNTLTKPMSTSEIIKTAKVGIS